MNEGGRLLRAKFLEGWRPACTSQTFPSHSCFLAGNAGAELLNGTHSSAETLCFVLPTVWCQTLCDPNEGREEKNPPKLGERFKPRTIYYTRRTEPRSGRNWTETGFPQKPFFLDELNINNLTGSEISQRLFPPFRSFFFFFLWGFFFFPWLSAGGNRLTGHRTGSENCRQLPPLCLLHYSLMASFNMHFSPNTPAGDTQ